MSFRLFFALWPDEKVAAALFRLAQQAHRRHGGRPMRQETLHLTLAFLGNVPEDRVAALRELLRRETWRLGSVCLDRLGYFRGPRIVWAGMGDCVPWLTAVHEQLLQALAMHGFSLPDERFRPHVSLLRRVDRVESAAFDPIQPIFWNVRRIVLVRSMPLDSGSRYEPLATAVAEGAAG